MTTPRTIYGFKQAVFTPTTGTALTYSAATGGLQGAKHTHAPTKKVQHASATQTQLTINRVIEFEDGVSIIVDDYAKEPADNAKGSLAVTMIEKKEDGTEGEVVATYENLVYHGSSRDGRRGSVGQVSLDFGYESADGTTRAGSVA